MARRSKSRKSEVLAAAAAVMADRGLDPFTNTAVAERSRLSQSGVRHCVGTAKSAAEACAAAAAAAHVRAYSREGFTPLDTLAHLTPSLTAPVGGPAMPGQSLRPYWGVPARRADNERLARQIRSKLNLNGGAEDAVVAKLVLALTEPAKHKSWKRVVDVERTPELIEQTVTHGILRRRHLAVVLPAAQPSMDLNKDPNELVLRIASELAVAPGPGGFSMSEIERGAGLPHMVFYNIAQGREELLTRVVERSGAKLRCAAEQPSSGPSPLQRLANLLAPLVRERATGYLVLDVSLIGDEFATRRAQVERDFAVFEMALVQIVEAGQARGYFRHMRLYTLARLCLDVLDGAYGLEPHQVDPYLNAFFVGAA